MPQPQPTSRQRRPSPSRCSEEVLPDQEAALRRHEHARLQRELGQRQREQADAVLVDPGLGHVALTRAVRGQARLEQRRAAPARLGAGECRAECRDVIGRDAAAAADDARTLVAPAERELRVGLGPDRLVELPARPGQMAEVRVDAERQLGEVAQPRDDSRHVVDGQAVDQQGIDAHLLEAPGRAAEEVALRRAPVLPVDAAHAVAAAPVGEPDRQPGLEQQLDHLERGRVADQREGLEQQHVGRVVREHACEQLDRLATARRVDFLGDREGDGAVLFAPGLRRGLARELDAEARDVDPVARLAVGEPRALLGLGRRENRPGGGGEDVAARGEVTAMHVEHGLGRLVERAGAPHLLIRVAAGEALDLGLDTAVENHALLGAEQRLDVAVAGRPRLACLLDDHVLPSPSALARARRDGRRPSDAGTPGRARPPARASRAPGSHCRSPRSRRTP